MIDEGAAVVVIYVVGALVTAGVFSAILPPTEDGRVDIDNLIPAAALWPAIILFVVANRIALWIKR